jgi:hypothetical protein
LNTVVLIAVWGTDGDVGNLLEEKLLSIGTETKLKLLFVIDFNPVSVLAIFSNACKWSSGVAWAARLRP